MKKRIVPCIIMIVLVGITLSGCVEEVAPPIEPKTNFVVIEGKGNYTTIQEAIENASSGDTIYVYSGIYYENLAITKSVNLIGEDRDTTIIIAKNNNSDVIEIARTTNVTISGFTLMNATKGNGIAVSSYLQNDNITISNCTIKNNFNGINIWGSSNNKISDCNILSNNYTGISIFVYWPFNYADNNIILNCTVSDNKRGIVLTDSNYNTITGCDISNNTGKGIDICGSSNNTLNLNEISNNNYGIYISNLSYVVYEGTEAGPMYFINSTNNIIQNNNFINNVNQAFDSSGCNNSWDNGEIGNYWSDYEEKYPDATQMDGVWGIPYNISGRNNSDRYPLVNPVEEEKEQSNKLSDLGYWQYGFGLNPPEEFRFAHVKEIGIPEYWYVNESVLGREVVFEIEGLYKVEDSSKVNISLIVSRPRFIKNNELVSRCVFDNRSLETYASDNMKYWYDMFTNVTFISNATTTVNGMDAYVSVFSGWWNETQMYKQKHVYVEKNGIGFKIIYSAIEDLYDEYIDVVDSSIDSFTIQ